VDFLLYLTLITSGFAFFTGGYLLISPPRSIDRILLALFFFLAGIGNAFIPLMTNAASIAEANIFAILSLMFFWPSIFAIISLLLIFPYDFAMLASPLRKKIFLFTFLALVAIMVLMTFLVVGASVVNGAFWFDQNTRLMGWTFGIIAFPITSFILALAYRTSEAAKKVAVRLSGIFAVFLGFLIMFVISGDRPQDWIWADIGFIIMFAGLTYHYATHKLDLVIPTPEVSSTGLKSSYKLMQGRIYIFEEERPQFSFELFSVILRNRCYDCVNDESFVCESLDCSSCTLPCPCKECTQYGGRTQGLVVARKHPIEIRRDYFIQTTPIVWLTSIPGKDNMDPAKLSLLTDVIVNFVEKSKNGVVLVEGIEYLVTANDFSRVLKAIDRWSEIVMSHASRLIISLDPKAFNDRELALIERSRESVRPDKVDTVEKILTSSS